MEPSYVLSGRRSTPHSFGAIVICEPDIRTEPPPRPFAARTIYRIFLTAKKKIVHRESRSPSNWTYWVDITIRMPGRSMTHRYRLPSGCNLHQPSPQLANRKITQDSFDDPIRFAHSAARPKAFGINLATNNHLFPGHLHSTSPPNRIWHHWKIYPDLTLLFGSFSYSYSFCLTFHRC